MLSLCAVLSRTYLPPPSASIYIHTVHPYFVHTCCTYIHTYNLQIPSRPYALQPRTTASRDGSRTGSVRPQSSRVKPVHCPLSTATTGPSLPGPGPGPGLRGHCRPANRAGTVVIHRGVERAGPLDPSVARLSRLLRDNIYSRRHTHTHTHTHAQTHAAPGWTQLTLAIAPR